MDYNLFVFYVPGPPQGKGRPRVFPIKRKDGTITHGGVTPEKTRIYEGFVKDCFLRAYPDAKPLTGPVEIEIIMSFPVPASASKKERKAMFTGEVSPLVKPDISNVQKAIEDALEGLAYVDDRQIVRSEGLKVYSPLSGVGVTIGERKPRWPL